MASSRCGWAWCWRQLSARSACPAAATRIRSGAIGYYGRRVNAVPVPTLGQGRNAVADFIPVARIADMLLNPGTTYRYNGETRVYPDIRLVYWAGGNPFHHHQDLNRLRKAFARLDTLVVHELAWTASARHADIVLPCTMTLEREDIGYSTNDPLMVAMHRIAEPFGVARDDYEIFSDLAERLGARDAFTEGRTAGSGWHISMSRPASRSPRGALRRQVLRILGGRQPQRAATTSTMAVRCAASARIRSLIPFRRRAGKHRDLLGEIAGHRDADCPGHPHWLEKTDVPRPGSPLYLIANQPATRLHSQLDFGGHSTEAKHRGREVARMNPVTQMPGYRRRRHYPPVQRAWRLPCCGACHGGNRPGIVQLPTGAWYDPMDPEEEAPLCVHGNPNVLTRDIGTSSFAQGCTGQLTTVEVERFNGNLPPIQAYEPPVTGEAAVQHGTGLQRQNDGGYEPHLVLAFFLRPSAAPVQEGRPDPSWTRARAAAGPSGPSLAGSGSGRVCGTLSAVGAGFRTRSLRREPTTYLMTYLWCQFPIDAAHGFPDFEFPALTAV